MVLAAGLVCLYEPQAPVLFSSDHVLERISPNNGLYAQQSGDPLEEYLRSLQLVRDVPVKLVLPGHGALFSDLAGRVDALIAHHEQRLQEMVDALADEDDGGQTPMASPVVFPGVGRSTAGSGCSPSIGRGP